MKRCLPSLIGLALMVGTLAAQNSISDTHSSTDAAFAHSTRALIEGFVTKDPGGEPVKKAIVELIAENQATGGNYTATTGIDGFFRMDEIRPGIYRLMVERVGYLEVDRHRPQTEGRLLTLAAGQELKSLVVRMQASAVVEGRVTDEDGEPMPNVQVTVLHQTFASGRGLWASVGGQPTNDLGEYRIANLPSGSYLISVTPAPDFHSLIENSGLAPRDRASGAAQEKAPSMSYLTTYYPGTRERTQASPVELHPGDDFPANFSLTPSPSMVIRGSVSNLPLGAEGMVILQSKDWNATQTAAQVRKDGTFEMRGVAPGSYAVVATVTDGGATKLAVQTVQVGSASIEALRLAPQTGAAIRGHLRFESKTTLGRIPVSPSYLSLVPDEGDFDVSGAMPIGEGFTPSVHVGPDGAFEWKNVPPGHYHIEFAGDDQSGPDWFLKSVVAGGRDVIDAGFNINGGAAIVDVVAGTDGGSVQGVALNSKGEPVANSVVVAVPETRLRARVDRFRKTVSDQSGGFTLHGIPPGLYTLIAWESADPDVYYNPQFLSRWEQQGRPMRVSEGERKRVQVVAIPASEENQ